MASRPSRAAAAKARKSFGSPDGSGASGGSLSPESRRLTQLVHQSDDSAEEFQLGSPHERARSADEMEVDTDEAVEEDEDLEEEEEDASTMDEGRIVSGAIRGAAKSGSSRRPQSTSTKKQKVTQGSTSVARGAKTPKASDGHNLYQGRRTHDNGAWLPKAPAHFVPKRCPSVFTSAWPKAGTAPKVALWTPEDSSWPHRGARKKANPALVDIAWWPGKARADAHSLEWTKAVDEGRRIDTDEQTAVGLPFLQDKLRIKEPVLLDSRQSALYTEPQGEGTLPPPLHPPAEAPETAANDEPNPLNFAELPPQADSEIKVEVGVKDIVEADLPKGESKRLDELGLTHFAQGGHILNTGGHVYSLEFAPVPPHLSTSKEYLAIATSKRPLDRTHRTQLQKSPAFGAIQLWSVSPGGSADLELTICTDQGIATQVAWCPAGHDYRSRKSSSTLRRLGLLACVFQTGDIGVYAVPHPDDLSASHDERYMKLGPVFSIHLPGTVLTCMQWAGGEGLAAGTHNGYIGVWHIGAALRNGKSISRPSHFIPVHEASVTQVSWQMQPPLSPKDGKPMLDDLPHSIFSLGLDCDGILTNIHDHNARAIMQHTRCIPYTLAWTWHLGASIMDQENNIRIAHARSDNYGATHRMADSTCRNLALATSPHHPWMVVGTVDGSVLLVHALRSAMTRSLMPHAPLWRLAHNRATGALRMVDQILQSQPIGEETPGSGAWHPAVAVHAVAFSPNIGRAWLLAGGTSCGLVRVDWMPKDVAGAAWQDDDDDD